MNLGVRVMVGVMANGWKLNDSGFRFSKPLHDPYLNGALFSILIFLLKRTHTMTRVNCMWASRALARS